LRKIESSSERSKLKIALILIVLLAYPALIHLSLAFGRPLLIAGTWLVISALGMVVAIYKSNASLALMFGALLTAGIGLWWWGEAVGLMYLPPVLINAALLILFGRTLLPGVTPLVARVAALWRGTLDQEVARYTRRVTAAWTVFFAIMALESMALALFAPLHVWSLFTNFVNYLLVLLFFVVEYQLRFYFFPTTSI
jgi:uncharacterized membrane protein